MVYGLMVPLDLRTLRILLAPLVPRGVPLPPPQGLQVEEGEGGVSAESEGGFRMFVAGRMVLRLFVESHGTLVAVSESLVMPLRDSDIDDHSFIVLTETKFSFRCIPVWDRYSPHRTRVEKKNTCDNAPMNVPITFRNKQTFSP
jgi:hypothetical protein